MRKLVLLALVAVFALSACAAWADGPAAGWGKDNTNGSSATGGYTASDFVYDAVAYDWKLGTESPEGGGGFAVRCDVEMWLNLVFNATDIYFHIGRDPGASPQLDQNVTGSFSSNNGQWLFVSKPTFNPTQDDITKLNFKHNIFGGASPGPTPPVTPIPVEWWLRDTADWRLGTYSVGGNNGNLWGVTWLIDNGTAGLHNFDIKCRIKPDRYQPDGHYEMDPVLVCSPEV